ncbi:MAG: sigma-70 family RNA polymerase sigma factor [Phycisphaerales bacterium]|nr:MAG: sigma-70 family RNA polymerase sigma factor [Phycisphaerales bacterium]
MISFALELQSSTLCGSASRFRAGACFQETSVAVPELTLLQRIAAGEQQAVKDCIDQYSGLIWSLARRLSGNPAEAEEGVQEVFIHLWEHADRFDPTIASETTFIAMLARRRLIDRRRKFGRRLDSAPLPERPVAGDAPESNAAEASDEALRVREAMGELRPEQQQVLQLSIMHGHTYEQIARTLEMPVGTVKTHARRGMIRLRDLLNDDQDTENEPDSGQVTTTVKQKSTKEVKS